MGKRVRELRTGRGWSQTELAQRLGKYGVETTQTTVAKLENGGRPIRLNEVAVLSELFGVPLVDMLRLADDAADGVRVTDKTRESLLRRQANLSALIVETQELLSDAGQRRDRLTVELAHLNERLGRLHSELAQAEGELTGRWPLSEWRFIELREGRFNG